MTPHTSKTPTHSRKPLWLAFVYALLLLLLPSPPAAADQSPHDAPFSAIATNAFHHPRPVTIENLPHNQGEFLNVAEPFVSRDGHFLFFNSHEGNGSKDLHWAERVGTDQEGMATWRYRGPLGPNINRANTVQGTPTMDEQGLFYFVDATTDTMVRQGRFDPNDHLLHDLRHVSHIPGKSVQLFRQRVDGNMDVEVSADGRWLIISRATWSMRAFWVGLIQRSDLYLAQKREDRKGFFYDQALSERLLANINSNDLEYAAALSADGRELFFTRLARADLAAGQARMRIMVAHRPDTSAPFGPPREITAIGHEDFVEGPSISGDGKVLYYHKREGGSFKLYRVAR